MMPEARRSAWQHNNLVAFWRWWDEHGWHVSWYRVPRAWRNAYIERYHALLRLRRG